ncbi:MAG TPA: PAS domain S-box protein [Thermoanaerobaculia bacterium]|nr:PAS domain S-box protein [Thermoanaerobaculia bacterium]
MDSNDSQRTPKPTRREQFLLNEVESLQVILSSIGDAVITTDNQSNVTFLNPAAEALTGWPHDEAAGRSLDDVFRIVNEQSRLPVESPVAKALREGTVVGLANHTCLIARDGTEIPIDDSAAPIRDERGEISGVVLVFRDITERRQAERARQDALRYAEDIIATLREPFLILDAGLRVHSVNRAFCQTFQVTAEETMGRFVYDLGNRQWDIPALRTLLEEILPDDGSFEGFEVEHAFEEIGKRTMLLNARKVRREAKETELILLGIEDITPRVQAEKARQEIETRYTSLVRNIKDHSIFMMDETGVITSWNVEAEKILGYSQEEILGTNFAIIFTPEDLRCGLPATELRLAREEGRAEDERWHVRKNGELFWALGIVTPMCDPEGNITGFSKILRDITERKRAEELLHLQSEALRDADRRKDEFLAMLSHELRNPLAPIRSSAQIIAILGETDLGVRRAAEVIERQTRHLSRIVDDLLDVARISQGQIKLQQEPIELSRLVADTVEPIRSRIESNGQRLTVTLSPEPLIVHGDAVRLSQVITNLINNASKYTEAEGSIGVSVERENAEGVVRIRDTGNGIAAEMLPHIFDLFAQEDRSLARSEGGLGIGLSVVKRLVEMHGGRVEALSEGKGKGSELVVRLPVLAEAETPPPSPVPDTPARHAETLSLRLLVVDDNADAADSLGLVLELLGHQVRTLYSGPAVLTSIREDRPDIVLLDIGLPGLDGYEVARRVRADPDLAGVRLIAVTGYGQEDDMKRTRESGFAAHLVKPVDAVSLQETLTALTAPKPEERP